MDKDTLKYSGEKDRATGLAGMAIALYACDGEQYLASVSVDLPVGQGLILTPDFGFDGNPSLSAKTVWNQLLKQYELSAAMVLGNAMCRSYVGRGRRPDSTAMTVLRDFLSSEGSERCNLEDDEAQHVYDKTFRFLERIFTHSTVATVARNLADTLCERRGLTASEIMDILSPLGR